MHLKLKPWNLKQNFALWIICRRHTLTYENIAALYKVICRQIKLVDKYFADIGNLYVKARYHLLAQTEPCISIIKLYWTLQKPHTNIWNNKKQYWAIWTTSHNISNYIAQYCILWTYKLHKGHSVQYGFTCWYDMENFILVF